MPNINDWLTYNGSEYTINGITYRNLEAQVKRNQEVSVYAKELSENNNTQIEAFREELADYDLLEGYVTPQVYGAIADGTTDCTDAIQQAIDSGKNLVFPQGTYRMDGTVTIASHSATAARQYINFDSSGAIISYTGTSYAFELIKLSNCQFHFGAINCTNGGGAIFFNATGTGINPNYDYSELGDSWSTIYVDIYFMKMRTTDDDNYLIKAEQDTINGTENIINEIRINNGRFERGNAIYLKQNAGGSDPRITTWRLFHVSFEGYTSSGVNHDVGGLRYDCASAYTVKKAFSFIDCRANERIKYAMDFSSDGNDCTVEKILWISTANCLPSYFKFTTKTSGIIIGPLYGTDGGNFMSNSGRIVNGYIVPDNYAKESSTGYSVHDIDWTAKVPYEAFNTILVNSANSSTTDKITLPRYYGGNGLNEIVFVFYHNHTSFEVYIEGNSTPILTFNNITANSSATPPVYCIIHAVRSGTSWRFWTEDNTTNA